LGKKWTIGRAPNCDVIIEDPKVSRWHVAIRATSAGMVIEELGSRSGTQVNGVPLVGQMPIRMGDVIKVGEHVVHTEREPLVGIFQRNDTRMGAGPPVKADIKIRRSAMPGGKPRKAPMIVGIALLGAALVAVVIIIAVKGKGGSQDGEKTNETATQKMPNWVYQSVMMVAVEHRGRLEGVGTGFVPEGTKVVVTNAHVALQVKKHCMSSPVCTPYVIGTSSSGRQFRITNIKFHPGWSPPGSGRSVGSDKYSPDLAVLYLNDTDGLPRGLPLAESGTVTNKDYRGKPVAIIGFPGDTMDTAKGEPTIDWGTVGRIIDPRGYIQHSASNSPGNSGSPMIVRGPKVIGVNYAGLGIRVIYGPTKDGKMGWQRIATASNVNLAVNIDLLADLL
jgi:pSer/pThr/pTyr-binding forkhead associated (FHA) protein